AAPPVASFTASPTNGTAPLGVTFTDASTGSITNWLWSFGDGFSVTNTSNVSVNHTYTNSGSYYPSLKVTGPGGNNTLTWTHYILVTSAVVGNPTFNSVSFVGGQLIVSGTNGTASTQYRVLISTNLSSGIWTPIYTNQFTGAGAFAYTNTPTGNPSGFFKLVSP
ncbi:MAG TPA: PKD domain-containing protein, partial [Verrucomicrobiae bacterium]